MATLPETPGSSPRGRRTEGPRERSAFSLDGQEAGGQEEESPHSAAGFDRPDQTVFDLTMDYSDDETLLDWEQYAGMRKFKCWGMDCSLVARFCPFMPWVPPEWYYRYSRRQRRLMKMGFGIFGVLLLLVVAATVLVSLLPSQGKTSTFGRANSECSWSEFSLPASLQPTQYDLELSVGLEAPFPVAGHVRVHANVTAATKCLVLHAVGMNVTHANRLEPHAHATWQFNDQEQVILTFEEPIRPPSVMLELRFEYSLRPGLSGFYRSNYTDASGTSRVMATTQMEANSARKAFPCLDEPHLKAVWNLTLTAPSGKTALFNTPETRVETLEGGMTRRDYRLTPPMSSYLVAIVVGDLVNVSTTVPYPGGGSDERVLSVWGTPDRASDLSTALNIAKDILPEYEQLFGVPYPLPKLDLVAIPDFAAGAMENWGLITYRETALLLKPNDSSIASERRVAVVIAHEMAHMWFGDLVTMRGWGELWLNEGFATYFENVGATRARPNYAYFPTFFADYGASAMAADALPGSTHPLATLSGMDTPERVEAMFDSISYDKGGSILRMLRAYLSRNAAEQPLLRRSLLQRSDAASDGPAEAFLRGLRQYLEKYALNNTSSADLWAEMDDVTGEDVSGWMRAWTFEPGFPRINVTASGESGLQLAIAQDPFQFNGSRTCRNGSEDKDGPWWVPLPTTRRGEPEPMWSTLAGCRNDSFVTLQDEGDWIKINAGQYGLYRVNYPDSLWRKLAAAAAPPALPNQAPNVSGADLAGLLDDSWALAQAGETPVAHFLSLLRSLASRGALEYAPWEVAAGPIIRIGRMLPMHTADPSCATTWTVFILSNVTNAYLDRIDAIPTNASAAPDVQHLLILPLLMALTTEYGDANASRVATSKWEGSIMLGQTIQADLRASVYASVVRGGNSSTYDAIKRIYTMASDPAEKARALRALSYAPTAALRNLTLEYSLSNDVRSQDTASLIGAVAGRGGESLQAAWDFVRRRYRDISDKLGGYEEAANAMGKLLTAVASELASETAIGEIDAIFDEHKEVLTEARFREAAKDYVRANLDWLRRNGGPVCEWLAQL